MGLKILIVEDDRHVRRILETLFVRDPEFAAFEPTVFLASDGNQGLDLLRTERPDVVITDLLMPNMDGFQFCRAVRDDPDAGGCTLIVMSAVYKDPGLIAKLKAELGVEFFAKPFQVRDLVRAVRRRIRQSAAAPSGDTTSRLAPVTAAMIETQRGSLARRPLPRLLLDCHETQATGTLTIRRNNARKDIYLLVGHPIGVDSTLRSETLSVYLVQRRILDEAQARAAIALARQRGLKFGQAVVEAGFLSENDVLRHLQAQVRYKLVTGLRWSDGEYQFVPGDNFSDRMTKSTVEPVRVVFTGLRRTARIELIQSSLAPGGRLLPTPRATRYAEPWRRVFGGELLERLHDRPSVEDLLFDFPPVEALPQIDALLLCGMASLEAPARRPAPPGQRTSKTPDPFRLDDLGRRQSGITEAIPEAPLDELFGFEESRVGPPSGLHRRPSELNAPVAELSVQESGVVEIEGPSPIADEEIAPTIDPRAEAIRRRIAQVYLTLHDADYYVLLGIDRNATFDQIADAFTRLAREFKLEQFAPYDLGRDYTRLEELNVILRKAFETLSDPIKRLEYDRARPEPQRRDDPFEAELLFRQGEEQLAGGDPAGAVPILEQAVARRPNHAEYHALLGWARLSAGGEQARTQAAADIARALAMEPDLAAGHEYAGRLAQHSGDTARAFDHLERALDVDPHRETAVTAYEQLCAATSEWRRLEKEYRRLIHRIGDRDRDLSLHLWWRLGDCYRDRLNDPNSARTAYEVAVKLAPDEPALLEALAQVTATDPERWRDTAQALRNRWRLHPADPTALRELFDLHASAGRSDEAKAVAAALVARGAAAAVHKDLYENSRASALRAPARALDKTGLARLVHREDDAEIAALFASMAPLVPEPDQRAHATAYTPPLRLAEAVARACAILGRPVPPMLLDSDLVGEIHVTLTEPAHLVVGPHAHDGDPAVVAARAARAMAYLLPGRSAADVLPSRRLKVYLLAAMTLAAPGLRVSDEEGAIAELRGHLERAPMPSQRRIRESVERVTRQKAVVNLSRWSRAVSRTADRLALLACGDLATAARFAREAGGGDADIELIDFGLSDEYAELHAAVYSDQTKSH